MTKEPIQHIVRAALRRSESPLTTSDLLTVIDGAVTDRTLRRWLVSWVEEGRVIKTGKKRGARYQWNKLDAAEQFEFLHVVPAHRRASVMTQIRDVWTHSSTSIEGNTLSLGDTFNILEHGLTISGKPLKEHQEIIGHAKAIEQIYALVTSKRSITKEDLFELHKSVQTERVLDINKPMGGWKVEPNGCNAVGPDDRPTYIEYAHPLHVEVLMKEYIREINQLTEERVTVEDAAQAYAKLHIGFVHIHPFWDGNGRLARLIANIPLLKSGLPPLVVDESRRMEYIKSLSTYQIETGQLSRETGVWPGTIGYEQFLGLCQDCYQITYALIEQARV
jgi:Fic family protein